MLYKPRDESYQAAKPNNEVRGGFITRNVFETLGRPCINCLWLKFSWFRVFGIFIEHESDTFAHVMSHRRAGLFAQRFQPIELFTIQITRQQDFFQSYGRHDFYD